MNVADPLALGKRMGDYSPEELERAFDLAGEEAARKSAEIHAQHEAFHGRPIRMVVVGRRRGYRGEAVCHDCYYGRAWR